MSVMIESVVQESVFTWRVVWSSTLGADTEVTISQNGAVIATTTGTEWTFTVPIGEQLIVEILDSEDEALEGVSSRRIGLGWHESEDENPEEVDYYRIDEFEDAAWSEVNRVPNDGSAFYFWESPYLANLAAKVYRVIAVGLNGNEGSAREFTTTVVGFDDVPLATYSYSSGTGKVTVTVG